MSTRRLRHMLWRSTFVRGVYHAYDGQRWAARGFSGPPPHPFKVWTVRQYAALGYHTFVETGTNYGDLLTSVAGSYDHCTSIEADPALYRLVAARMARYPHAQVYFGDSAIILPAVLLELREPSLFWLDAHPEPGDSGAVPLLDELRAIVRHPVLGHTVLIDDAHMLGTNGWPSPDEVEKIVSSSGRCRRIGLANDITRIQLD
jgi:hypothetical protein